MSENKVLQVLMCARELLSDPARWTQGSLARTKTGRAVVSDDPDACKFCSMGAVVRCLPERVSTLEEQALVVLEKAMDGNVVMFNDASSTTHKDVLERFDRAIASAKERAS